MGADSRDPEKGTGLCVAGGDTIPPEKQTDKVHEDTSRSYRRTNTTLAARHRI